MISFLAGLIAGWFARVVSEKPPPFIRWPPIPDFRISEETGLVWQQCPRCGQERIASYNGILRHDEFCPGLADPPDPRPVEFEDWLRSQMKP